MPSRSLRHPDRQGSQDREAWDEYRALAADAPTWTNRITVESAEAHRQFDPTSSLPLLAPTALLVLAGERDAFLPVDAVRAAYERAGEPKALQALPVAHFEVYREPWLSTVATRRPSGSRGISGDDRARRRDAG